MKTIFNQIKRFENIELQEGETFSFTLPANTQNQANKEFLTVGNKTYTQPQKMEINKKYKVTVKKYMTEPATSTFDFQDKWNNGVPMPLCVMQGTVMKETRGMIYMNLEGVAEAKEKYNEISSHLVNIKWEGWVIRSAIKQWEEV